MPPARSYGVLVSANSAGFAGSVTLDDVSIAHAKSNGFAYIDGFAVAGDFLLRGGHPRGGKRPGMGREGFRKHTVDFIGPAAVVLDNLVGDVTHETPFEYAGSEILSRLKIRGESANLFVRPTTGCPPT
jgi:hypothetical protein